MCDLKWIPGFYRPPIQDDLKLGCITIDEPMEDHAKVGADILKAQIEGLLLQPRQTTQRVRALPQDQCTMFKLE
jgi:hypothetical protein